MFFKSVADDHIQKKNDSKKAKLIEKQLIKGIAIDTIDIEFLENQYTKKEKELEARELKLAEQERKFKERQKKLRQQARELNEKKKLLTVSNLKN